MFLNRALKEDGRNHIKKSFFFIHKCLSFFLSFCNGKRVERLLRRRTQNAANGNERPIASFLFLGDDGRDSVVQPIIFYATDLKSKLGNTVSKSRKEGHGRNLNTNKLKLDSKYEEHTTKILHAPSWNCSVPSTHRNLCFPILSSEQFHVHCAQHICSDGLMPFADYIIRISK